MFLKQLSVKISCNVSQILIVYTGTVHYFTHVFRHFHRGVQQFRTELGFDGQHEESLP